MSDFETRVLPVVTERANRFLRDEQLVQDAIGLSWFRYRQNPRAAEIRAESHAWYAIRQVLSGRRLPGEKARGEDALDHRDTWRGGDLGELRDRRPGPDQIAAMREEWEVLQQNLNERQRQMLRLAQSGMRTKDLAALLGISPARVSQLRREIQDRTKD